VKRKHSLLWAFSPLLYYRILLLLVSSIALSTPVFSIDTGPFQFTGRVDMSTFDGDVEYYEITPYGLNTKVESKGFDRRQVEFQLSGERHLGRLHFSLENDYDSDIYSDTSLKNRYSNLNNLFNFTGTWDLSQGLRVRGELSNEVFKDRSFPEYTTDDSGAVFALEKMIRSNVVLSGGYENHDVEFENDPTENYTQQDAFVSFYRYSPGKKVLRHNEPPLPPPQDPFALRFSKRSSEILDRWGYDLTASHVFKEQKALPNPGLFVERKVQSDMVFEAEGRVRYRELYNELEKSYMETQGNLFVQFLFDESHYTWIYNRYSDRDYAQESIADNIHSYRRDLIELAHYIARDTVMLENRLTYDAYFHKDGGEEYDFNEMNFYTTLSWDLQPNWNMSYYGNYRQLKYEDPRPYFSDSDYEYHALSGTWYYGPQLSFTGTVEKEIKEVKQNENEIDSSYDKNARSITAKWQQTAQWSYYCGWRWEREKHEIYEENDSFEDMIYAGTEYVW
jgi:hypothetical protein